MAKELATPDPRKELISNIRRTLGRKSLYAFSHLYLRHQLTAPSCRFHYDLCGWIEDDTIRQAGFLVGACPRGHAKTTYGTTANGCRIACYKLRRNIPIFGANQKEASDKLRNIAVELDSNKRLQEDFGDSIKPAKDSYGSWVANSDTELILKNGVRFVAFPMGGKIRGSNRFGVRPDYAIFDDPEDDESASSEVMRLKYMKWFRRSLLPAMDMEHGSICYLGTILHQESILSWLLRDADALKFKYPAVLPDLSLLWPERYTLTRLKGIKLNMGSNAFAQELLNIPLGEEKQVVLHNWWRWYKPADVQYKVGRWWVPDPDHPALEVPLDIYAAVDPAIAQSKDSDYFAYCVIGMPAGKKKYYVLEVYRGRLSFAEQQNLLNGLAQRWHPYVLRIENEAYQASLGQAVWDRFGIPIEPVNHRRGKDARLRSSAIHIEHGDVYLPTGDPAIKPFCDEIEGYPSYGHEDQFDAFAMCIERCVYGGSSGAGVMQRKLQTNRLLDGMVSEQAKKVTFYQRWD